MPLFVCRGCGATSIVVACGHGQALEEAIPGYDERQALMMTLALLAGPVSLYALNRRDSIVSVTFGLVLLAACCAIMAVRATRLLGAALWLAGVSIAVALMLYQLGAVVMAVIELSLSVGLITILLVFAISMVGADSPDQPVRRLINVPLVVAMVLLVAGLSVPLLIPQEPAPADSFSATFWQHRESDVIAQISLIFAGVLGVLGLLAEGGRVARKQPTRMTTPSTEVRLDADLPTPEPELERL